MKKIFRKIHLWLSIPFGLIVSVICFSGAALVFENEITELCRPDFFNVKKTGAVPLPPDILATKVAESLPDSVSVTGINIPSDPEKAYQVTLSQPRRAVVYVNQYTGEIKGKYERIPFFLTMFRLHRWLLDSMTPGKNIFWGKMIVGISTLMFVFILLTGLFIWLPCTYKAFKNSLKITVKKGWRRFWFDLHVTGGMYAFIFLLVMALTGLTWSFPWYRSGFYYLFNAEMQQSNPHGNRTNGKEKETKKEGREKNKQRPFGNWQKVYEQLAAQNPDYSQIGISKGSATVSFNHWGNQRAADRYQFNPRNGEITGMTLYKDTDRSAKIRGWIYSVHVGSWGGMLTRILTFIAALIGGSLPLTGYYLWIRKWKKKQK